MNLFEMVKGIFEDKLSPSNEKKGQMPKAPFIERTSLSVRKFQIRHILSVPQAAMSDPQTAKPVITLPLPPRKFFNSLLFPVFQSLTVESSLAVATILPSTESYLIPKSSIN